MKIFAICAGALLTLTACGALVSNTDKPAGLYIGGAAPVAGGSSVAVATSAPISGGQKMSGVSCKNKIWEPSPSNYVAVAVLKREVGRAGFNSVYITEVKPDPNALLKNCWSAIIAYGIAFNS